jgi:hypothetical protein
MSTFANEAAFDRPASRAAAVGIKLSTTQAIVDAQGRVLAQARTDEINAETPHAIEHPHALPGDEVLQEAGQHARGPERRRSRPSGSKPSAQTACPNRPRRVCSNASSSTSMIC